MRILHVVHQYIPEHVGGTELYTKALAERQGDLGISVAIFAPAARSENLPEEAVENGVRVYRVPISTPDASKAFLATFNQPEIEEALKDVVSHERPDLVHVQHLKGLPVDITEYLNSEKLPYVVTLHDYWYLCANAQLLTNYDSTICSGPKWGLNCGRCALVRGGWTKAQVLAPIVAPAMVFRNRKLANVLSKARQLIAPTKFVRQTYAALGIPESSIVVIPHGIKIPDEINPKKKQGDDKLMITYVGGLSWQKGIHVLIEAFNQLPADHFKLTIYGDTEAFPDYIAGITAQIHHPGVKVAGRLPRNELWSALANSDVVVVPSLWYETASLIIQEAFAVGVPVVASDIGALQERVIDGEDGFLFPPGDAPALREILIQLQQKPQLLEELRAGIKPVRTIDQHTNEILDVYRFATNS